MEKILMASIAAASQQIADKQSLVDEVLDRLAQDYGVELGTVAPGPLIPSDYRGDPQKMNIFVRNTEREYRLAQVIEALAAQVATLSARVSELESKKVAGGKK
jgi:hypothetical protein